MGIVNKDYYPYLISTTGTTQIEYLTVFRGYWAVRNWDDGYNYWYCSIFQGKGLENVNFLDLIPNEVLTDESTFIVLCNAHEAHLDVVEPIYKNLILKLKINPKKIILVSENADICTVVKEIAVRYNLDTINVEWSLNFERNAAVQCKDSIAEISKTNTLEKKAYAKSFLNFNGRWRNHRPCCVALLYCMNLLDKGFVSLGKADDNKNWKNSFDTFSKLVEEDSELYDLIIDNKKNILNLPEMYLDTTNLVTNRNSLIHQDINHDLTRVLYEDSYFSIVSETYFFEQVGRTFTEKTFKPIIYKHPFILISDPYSLVLLRKLGYKTFHPFIDESYDNEPNNVTRLKMILNEVKRLSNLSKLELDIFIDNVKEITLYNHNVLINKPKFSHIHKIL